MDKAAVKEALETIHHTILEINDNDPYAEIFWYWNEVVDEINSKVGDTGAILVKPDLSDAQLQKDLDNPDIAFNLWFNRMVTKHAMLQ